MKIGDKLWVFDINHRVYRRDENGHSTGGPIWREHWREQFIIGETRVSWLVGASMGSRPEWAVKLPKKDFADGACPDGWALSEEHIAREAFVHEHAWQIADRVRRADYDKLRKIAVLVGYEANP